MGPKFNTYFSAINKGKPDLIFENIHLPKFAINISSGDRLPSSDHIPIHVEINSNPIAIPSEPRFNYNRANWEGFRHDLNQLKHPNTKNITINKLDKIIQDLHINIMKAAENNIPNSNYKIINAFKPSTKTNKLNIIFNQRHNLYKTNMTPEKAIILNKIRTHIINSYNNDFNTYWLNLTKDLELIKNETLNIFLIKLKI